jgi:hypothetical protein
LKLPGIHAISISDAALAGKPFDWTPEIVYFGMTNSLSGLAGRLKPSTAVSMVDQGTAVRSAFCLTTLWVQEPSSIASMCLSGPSNAT